MSVGFVVVSHSRALAEAAVTLASQMIPGDPVPIELAAGTADGGLGTDATAIQTAIERVDEAVDDGVIVLLDLGSAIMSTEMALEMLEDVVRDRVDVSPGPLVEGLVIGVVQASTGAKRSRVLRVTRDALQSKSTQLGG
ncbi:dihydroxyacetone kinase phosphoryl donor subunit DhaM [Mobilicoccus sp.]|uniref:dihydroxyacetone kinase phosphoryl donor subunit DhaM n=1 Tax=Mobilicoccus sp. TaxID=2034349 RepID=UPI0028A01DCC|nr:dihydroxyacetone kinase phosphoryl donor subunit DhaM [Mobilicoccus sp.]